MDLRRILLALYPRSWRRHYGEEFAALLDDTELGPAAVFDVVVQAARLHVHAHQRLLQVWVATAVSAFFVDISYRAGLTANILWAPTNPVRALALFVTISPWLVVVGDVFARRLQRHNPPDHEQLNQ
jgi:hypothetical protein